MKAAVYARFSSDNQREQSIDDQVRVCKDYAFKNNIIILEKHIYTDEAQSGSIRNRPGLESLKAAAENKEFDAVLIDDSSRLSRDNQHFNTLLCLFQYWGVDLISISDGLDTKEEHARVAYQFRGIFNELYLSDLRKKTQRGQMGQVLRGYTVGSLGYGYRTKPVGETKFDKKGRMRADGFHAEVIPEEARIVERIFKDFSEGKAVTAIVAELNIERVPTRKAFKEGWRISTVTRILKNDKYIGKYVWNRFTTVKDPLTGKKKRKERSKEEWLIKERSEMRIISDELWEATVKRWQQLEEVYPTGKGKPGFSTRQQSRVKTNPSHLLSGSLQCGECGGSIALVSGKGPGYYGCLNASRKACNNKVLVSRAKLENKFLAELCEKILTAEQFQLVYDRVAKAIKEEFSEIPKEIHLKKTELNSVESRLHNFIEFVAQGRAPKSITEAMVEAEGRVTELKKELESLERTKDSFFEPPPKEWIESRLENVKTILEQKTEKSALLLRDYLGTVRLIPKKPEVGKSYYFAETKVNSFALLDEAKGSNVLRMWTQAGSNR